MKISNFMNDKILVQFWANELVKNSNLLDELEPLDTITCSHCGKEYKRESEDGKRIEDCGMCFNCEKVINDINNFGI